MAVRVAEVTKYKMNLHKQYGRALKNPQHPIQALDKLCDHLPCLIIVSKETIYLVTGMNEF